ncbi:MAG TPA: outer membrane beta-barrel protein [Rhizomicrobium sp.]|nr:outer membrane beta-barrel protein [Rhizomicrobium sp.]
MTLRKLLMASAAVVSLTATISSADAAQPYASLFGGASFLQSQNMSGKNFTRTTAAYYTGQSTQSVDTAFKTGFVLGGNAGIEWGSGLRTELELAFRQNSSKNHARLRTHYRYQFFTYISTGEGGGYTTITTAQGGQDNRVPANLKMRAWSLMANAWYDFDLGLPVTPYVGGGLGMAMVKISGDLGRYDGSTLSILRLHEKNDTVFAWQVGAGVSIPISDNMKLFADYRYFAANDAHLKIEPGFHGGSIDADFNSHNLMVGVRFNF